MNSRIVVLCSPYGDDLAEVHVLVVDLGDEERRHSLVQRCTVHVDSRPDRNDKRRHSSVHTVVVLQTAEGHWHGR